MFCLRLHSLRVSLLLDSFAVAWLTNCSSYDQGVLGGLIALPNFLESNNMNPDNADEQGTVVAIYSVGCFTGCLMIAFIGNMLGRRMFIVIGGLMVILGGSLQAGAQGTEYLYSGRIIGGIGMGQFPLHRLGS